MEGLLHIKNAVTPIIELVERGLKPNEVKEIVVKSLEPYFENKDVLEEFALDSCVPASITLSNLQNDQWFFEMFENCLAVYHTAKAKDPSNCYESIIWWQPQIAQSISTFWSVLNLEVDKNRLRNDEFLHECLRNIGALIEGITKPYLKALLSQIRIVREEKAVLRSIDALGLGEILNELIQKSGFPLLFSPPPYDVPLNQWRNIAYHNTARTQGEEITCWYGKPPRIREIRLTRNELLNVVEKVYKVFVVCKLADSIFTLDNGPEIFKDTKFTEIREEAGFLDFAAGLASQGFEILEYSKNDQVAMLIIRDRTSLDPDNRRVHATQFLFPLWILSNSKNLIVEYREQNGSPNLRVKTTADLCAKVFHGELDILAIPREMEIFDLRKAVE
jgi:hypothetical protein